MPQVPALVPVVDIAGGEMHLHPPEGLLDLAAPPPPEEVLPRTMDGCVVGLLC